MKNQFVVLVVSATIYTMHPVFGMEIEGNDTFPCSTGSQYLKWQDRPSTLQKHINWTFERLARDETGSWLFNGNSSYAIAKVEEEKLVHHIIISNPNQKEFFFLDIGAGNFEWGDYLADCLNEYSDIANDVKINIIGVRGERFTDEGLTVNGKCNIYKIGAFKIENIEESFKEKRIKNLFNNENLDLTNLIDGAWTNWCLRHLAEPVGTLVQIYKLLRSETGLFFGGNFYYGLKGQSDKEVMSRRESNRNITRLLLDMNVPFLIEPYGLGNAVNNFVLKKSTVNELKLPLKYSTSFSVDFFTYQVHSEQVTKFEHIGPIPDQIGEDLDPYKMFNTLCGDKDLFDFFQNNSLFHIFGENPKYISLDQKK